MTEVKNELSDVNEIKLEVLQKTAQYAYDGTLKENMEKIPYEIIPTIKPKFRCCVYREREIIRQRVSLSIGARELINQKIKMFKGELPIQTVHDDKILSPSQVVHIIPSACEGCPIDNISVTSNCQACLAQKCVKSCKFDAIIKTPSGAIIDQVKCKNCGACVKSCPYNAIVKVERPCKGACPVDAIKMDENDIAVIDEEKCINCGNCVTGCPFGAVSDVSMVVEVIDEIVAGKDVYAIVAPSIEGQFGEASLGILKEAIKGLGFKDVYEAALGADAVAYKEADELVEHFEKGKVMTTSCCPSFVNLIDKHYPELKGHVSSTVSPMVAAARYVRRKHGKCKIAFIGPCITKKNEVLELKDKDVDFAITFDELVAMFKAKKVELMDLVDSKDQATSYGKGFARSGGVTNAVLKVLEEKDINLDIKVCKCNGIEECKKALTLLKVGKFPNDFIEGMSCEHGCINGPSRVKDVNVAGKIFEKYKLSNENHDISEVNNKNDLESINIHKH